MSAADRPDRSGLDSGIPTGPDGRVEVNPAPGGAFVVMRGGLLVDTPELRFTSAEWDAFIRGVKDGEFDFPERRMG